MFRMLESCKDTGKLHIDCVDPLGRSALLMAIDNENLEMVELLLENKVRMDRAGNVLFLQLSLHGRN